MTEQSDVVVRAVPQADEHAVVVNIRLADGAGSDPEQARLSMLATAVGATLEAAEGCELGACQVKQGFGVLYCYGPNAARLFDLIEPILREYRPPEGSFAIVRHGGATDTQAPRDRIEL
jgi:hypothetical protein